MLAVSDHARGTDGLAAGCDEVIASRKSLVYPRNTLVKTSVPRWIVSFQ
jgi:hypothetical protein